MTTKFKVLSLIAVSLAAAIYVLLSLEEKSSTLKSETVSFALKDTAGVTKFVFGDDIISRVSGDNWQINGNHKVDDEMLFSLFSVMQSLEVKRPVSDKQRNEVMDLFIENGVEVKMYSGDTEQKSYFVAGNNETSYAMMGKDAPVYEIYIPGGFVMPIRSLFDIREEEWRDLTLLRTTPQTLKRIELSYPADPKNDVRIYYTTVGKSSSGLDSGYFKVNDFAGEKIKSRRLYNYILMYQSVKAQAYYPNAKLRDSLMNNVQPICNIKVTDLTEERNNSLNVYALNRNLYGINMKTQELVLLDPKRIQPYLATPKEFLLK